MRELLQRRVAAGTFDRDPDRFLAEFVERCKVETGTMTLPDGRTISIRNSPVEGGGWVSAHEDVTEQLRAERELHRTKAFLDTVIENVPATLIVKDAFDHSYKLINRGGEKFFGLPREELIGKTIYDVHSKEDADAIAGARQGGAGNRASSYLIENRSGENASPRHARGHVQAARHSRRGRTSRATF